MIYGYKVYQLPPMLQFTGKYEPCRYDVHPIVKWLSKYLPINPWIDGQKPVMEDVNANKLYRIGNDIYAGTNSYKELKRGIEQKGQSHEQDQ